MAMECCVFAVMASIAWFSLISALGEEGKNNENIQERRSSLEHSVDFQTYSPNGYGGVTSLRYNGALQTRTREDGGADQGNAKRRDRNKSRRKRVSLKKPFNVYRDDHEELAEGRRKRNKRQYFYRQPSIYRQYDADPERRRIIMFHRNENGNLIAMYSVIMISQAAILYMCCLYGY